MPETEEGILYADLLAIAKSAYDPAGHYSRPDVFRLTFDPRPKERVEYVDPTADEAEPKEPGPDITPQD